MRRFGLIIAVASCLLNSCSGCGTFEKTVSVNSAAMVTTAPGVVTEPNWSKPRYAPFGGVAKDFEWIMAAGQPIDVIRSIVDLPFSLIGDIVTLPWIANERLIVVRSPVAPQDEWRRFWMSNAPSESSANPPPAEKMPPDPRQ